jgi:hypothetical protein
MLVYHLGVAYPLLVESAEYFRLEDLALPPHESGVYVGDVVFGAEGVAFCGEREPTREEWVRYGDGGYPWVDGRDRHPNATDGGDADWAAPMSFRYDVDPEREVTGFTWCSLCGRRSDLGVVAQSVHEGTGRGGAGFFCATCVRSMAAVVAEGE